MEGIAFEIGLEGQTKYKQKQEMKKNRQETKKWEDVSHVQGVLIGIQCAFKEVVENIIR